MLGRYSFAPGTGTLAGAADALPRPFAQELLAALEAGSDFRFVLALGLGLGVFLGTTHEAILTGCLPKIDSFVALQYINFH
jgi:hypothetical protein